MPTIPERLEAATALAETDSSLLHDIVHGPVSGATSLVTVESGTVKTVARILDEAQIAIDGILLGSILAVNISDSTAVGRTLLTAADVAAQRTALGLGSLATLSAAPAASLAGTTLAANVVNTSITGTGALTSGSINWSGNIATTGSGSFGLGTFAGVSGANILTVIGADTDGNADVEIRSVGSAGNSRLFFGDTAGQTGSLIFQHATNSFVLNAPISLGSNSLTAGAISGTTGTFTGSLTAGTGSADTYAVRLHGVGGTSFVAVGNSATVPSVQAFTAGFAAPTRLDINPSGGDVVIGGVATITSTGLNNTVIGATTPAAGSFTTLSASGNLSLTGTNASVLGGVSSGSSSFWNSTAVAGLTVYGASHATKANDTEIFTGTVSHAFSDTGLAVTGYLALNGATEAASIKTTFTGSTIDGITLKDSNDQSNAVFAVFRKANGTAIGSITRVTTTDAVAYNTTSDARLKTNIRDLTNSGTLIDCLRPVIHDWKSGTKNTYGFIAQEVHQAFPQAVTKGDDDPETITQAWAMDAGKFMPLVIAELQALRKRVAELEAV